MNNSDLLAHYKRIIEISQQLNTTYDHIALLKKIVAAVNELIQTEASSILLLDKSTGKLRFAITSNIKPHEMEAIEVPLEGSIAGWIVTHGEPRVIEDVTQEPQHFQGVDSAIQFRTRNLLGVPMKTHEHVIGVLQAVNKRNNLRFSDNDISTLKTLASQAGMAIENARLFQQSDFISDMVHELRTPLVALKASTTLLQRPDFPEEKRGDLFRTMHKETERLITLTNDFLDVARLESGRTQMNFSSIALHPLLEESVTLVASQAEEKGVTITLAETDFIVQADEDKLKQVMLNLLSNAIKYNRPSGTITISMEKLSQAQEQAYVEISVADTGYGISEEHQKHMFQKFYRVPLREGVEKGTGLGLTICKHIIEAHGGRIRLQSEPDKGTTFFFSIPVI